MQEKDIELIYFSPTGTSKKVVKEIAKHISLEITKEYNLTIAESLNNDIEIRKNTLSIIAAPVYSGRLPLEAVKRLENIKANDSWAVIVVVYGNRDFDDALLELKEIVQKSGFRVLAAAAFIGEHSYSSPEYPLALHRPDASDIDHCHKYADEISRRLTDKALLSKSKDIQIPGNKPYKERPVLPPLTPETIEDECGKCGICAEVCPTNAIGIIDIVNTDPLLCIWCCACVKACPEEARIFNHPTIIGIREKLKNNCQDRKEPQFFF